MHQKNTHWYYGRLNSGMQLLYSAGLYGQISQGVGNSLAVEMRELLDLGMSSTDLRWLILQGTVEHLHETTYPNDTQRSFRPGGIHLGEHSCFLLTSAGMAFASEMVELDAVRDERDEAEQKSEFAIPDHSDPVEKGSIPCWDGVRQELWFLGRLVKQFRLPSPNQVTILTAFQEDGWPPRIDDPLPPSPNIDSRRRLSDTIRNLNRSRLALNIHFSGDGTGEGILWERQTFTRG